MESILITNGTEDSLKETHSTLPVLKSLNSCSEKDCVNRGTYLVYQKHGAYSVRF
jgi:hypothetical protein